MVIIFINNNIILIDISFILILMNNNIILIDILFILKIAKLYITYILMIL